MSHESIKNIVLFVCDSLRWDYLPQEINNLGLTCKTIASSLYTGASFPSMISGLYPPKTGCFTWEDILPGPFRGLLNFKGYENSLWCETTWTDLPPNDSQIHSIVGNPPGIPLDIIEPPFIYIEDDKGGHCPYGEQFGDFMGSGCPDFFTKYGVLGKHELKKKYKQSIDESLQRFKIRIDTLISRNLLDSTLVIFTSDHGELLGDYGGLAGHGRPACPELVYVPTVYIHPKFNSETITTGVCRHVDLYPTIANMLEHECDYPTDGINIFGQNKYPSHGFNFRFGGYLKNEKLNLIWKRVQYKASSVWDENGGYAYNENGGFWSFLFFFYRILLSNHPEFNFLRNSTTNLGIFDKIRNHRHALKPLYKKSIQYGEASFDDRIARKRIEDYLNTITSECNIKQYVSPNVDQEAIRRLKSLGYLD